jgi:Acetyltransferase (GNAT) domain
VTAGHPFASRRYAEALAGPGAALAVPEWGSHVIRRPIDLGGLTDAVGTYPLQVFARGADVAAGLKRLAAQGLVSAVLVPDPLLCPAADLARDFAVCRPFKTHYLIDPASGPFAPSKHHRQELRRAERHCRVERVALADHLATWSALYADLVSRRAVTGAADFAPAFFQALAAEPAMQAFAAYAGDEIAGMAIWFAAEGVVYYHLSAVNAAGYASGAAYALVAAAVEHFAGQGVIHLGGGAGARDGSDGLAAFKRGFANGEVTAHICGAVLDSATYAQLSGQASSDFFPAYRAADRLAA